MRVKSAAGLCILLALLVGCASSPPVSQVLPSRDVDLSTQVPFFPQTEYQCGPAALATVLGASGAAITPEQLAPQVYLPGRKGSLQLELIAATRRAGRIPYVLERESSAIAAELEAGRPVLILQNLLVRTVPKWHYSVVVGASQAQSQLRLNSGQQQNMSISQRKFMRTWDWAGRWALVSLRPGELPAQADVTRYLAAVADFEAVSGTPPAQVAYQAALQRWPNDPRVHLAVGNAANASGEVQQAARHYRDGLALSSQDPVLLNNYASVTGGLGCKAQALQALNRVGEVAPRWREALAQTRREVESADSKKPAATCAALALPRR